VSSSHPKLELTWPHKDRRLLYDYDDEGKPHPRFTPLGVPEPRVLLDLDQFGSETGKAWDAGSNLLIRGDNLLALKSLAETYAKKVKLIYIDPPFNTGMAFPEYEDGLEHSTWLTMMRDRLELLRDLLAKDGSIWVEIDDTEFGYLNVLMDEVFGRDNRIATVTVKRSAGTGHKAINPGPVNVTDFLLGYARDRASWRYRPQLVLRAEYDKNYNKWIEAIDESPERWQLEALPDVFARSRDFETAKAARRVMGGPAFTKAMHAFALEHNKHVVRLAQPDYKAVSKAAREMIDQSKNDKERVYQLARDAHSDMFFFKGERILFLSDRIPKADADETTVDGETDEEAVAELDEDDEQHDAAAEAEADEEENSDEALGDEAAAGEPEAAPGLAEKLTNFWDDIPWQGIAKEGGVKFPKNKKPERLLERVIAMATDKGDLVLDSFAGSGTTGAVAHKMGRRWIMVEMGEHADTLALPRLKSVVDGSDKSGVTKMSGWQGGGGFRYLTLADPLLQREPELGLVVLNPAYSNGLLLTAVCLREGFTPTGDTVLHGHGGERTFAHVSEDFITSDYLSEVAGHLPDGATVTVYCLAYDSALERPENVVVRKLPGDLANRYCDAVAVAS
jgi:adenine-specific DNA-methyltransferase